MKYFIEKVYYCTLILLNLKKKMDDERKHRKIRVKVIHVHHYHHHHHRHHDNDKKDTNYIQQQTIHKKQSYYSTSRHTRRSHHSQKRDPNIPNREHEYNFSSDDDKDQNPMPDDEYDDSYPSGDYDDIEGNPEPRKPLRKAVTYYIPESPQPKPYYALPEKTQKPKAKTPEREKYPYPIEKLRYLRKHPLPGSDEENPDVIHSPHGDWPVQPRKKIRFISEFEKYSKPKNADYSYWTDIEAVLTQERLGGYNEIPPKQLPMMYPFTQMSPRKLPWDFSDVELVPTRPNKPVKPFKPKSFAYFEESVLEIMRVPTPGNHAVPLLTTSDEFNFVESWIRTCLWKPFNYLTELTRFGFSSRLLELERGSEYVDDDEISHRRIHLVLFPCEYPLKYKNNPLPQTIVTHRCVTNGHDLIHLMRKIKKVKFSFSFLLCAAYLGNQAIDYHPKCIPTQSRIDSLMKSKFDSFFYREGGVESIMIFDSSNVVPLYACKMSSKKPRI